MNHIFEYIVDYLIKNSIIKESDKELYAYGIHLMFSSIVDISIVLIASILIHRFIETLMYLFAFIPLRIYTGGYHADSEIRCFIVFIITFILFILSVMFIPTNMYWKISAVSCVLVFLCVMILSPIENINKLLNRTEIKAYKTISRFIMITEICIVALFMFINRSSEYMLSIALGELSVALSMLAAIIKKLFVERGSYNEKVKEHYS